MRPSSAKAKGRRLQNEIQQILLERFPQFEPDDARPAIMGESGVDIKMSPFAQRQFPYSIEAKCQEKLNIWDAWKQALKNMKEKTSPLLIFRRNHHETLVTMRIDDFFNLLEEANRVDKP